MLSWSKLVTPSRERGKIEWLVAVSFPDLPGSSPVFACASLQHPLYSSSLLDSFPTFPDNLHFPLPGFNFPPSQLNLTPELSKVHLVLQHSLGLPNNCLPGRNQLSE